MSLILKKDNVFELFFKYLWIIILLPKYIQLIVLYVMLIVFIIHNKGKIYIDNTVKMFFYFMIIYFFSIMVSIFNGVSSDRIYATINTFSLWLLGIIVYGIMKNNVINYQKIKKYMYINIVILLILSILMIVCRKFGLNPITIFSKTLYRYDWLYNGSIVVRFRGYMDYPNLCCLFYVLACPFLVNYLNNKNKIFAISFLIISIIPVYLCGSRMGIIASLFLIENNILSLIKTKNKRRIIIALSFIALIFMILIDHNQILSKIDSIINSRSNSTSTRINLYRNSIEKTIDNSIFIGMGVKEKETINSLPLGSHSTYIGIFYKTGIIGVMIFLISFISLIKGLYVNTYKNKLLLNVFVPIIIFLFMLFLEDLDGTDWLLVLFFCICGIFSNPCLHSMMNEVNEK